MDSEPASAGPCLSCLRRSWLLGELSAVLDYNCRADDRLLELLKLADEQLIEALGGRRRAELQRRHAGFRRREIELAPGTRAICRHEVRYPAELRHDGAPALLHVSGGLNRLRQLASEQSVALLGTGRASAYGIEATRELARELAASGVTLITERRAGVAFAAQQGALDVGGAMVLIAGDGLGAPPVRARLRTYERLALAGCAVSELPGKASGRSWGTAAGARIAVGLAAITVVLEAEDRVSELRGAWLARKLGRPIAALPGPVSARTSDGCHRLLREGARLVGNASDVLDLLYGIEQRGVAGHVPSTALPRLSPAQREVLALVGAGANTLGELTTERSDRAKVLRELAELELLGLLSRGAGGHYVLGEAQR